MNPTDDASPGRAPGAILAAERERQGLSRADIAQRLHMSAYQIEAIEAADYERLPRGTFLRGFVRNYCKVVGLDPDPILNSLAEESPQHSRPGIVVASQNIRFDPLGDRLSNPYVKAAGIATVVVAVGFATMYWWLFVRPAPPPGSARKATQVAETPKVALPAPSEARIEPPKPEPEPPRVEAKPEAKAPAKPAPVTVPAPAPAKAAPAPAFAEPAPSVLNAAVTQPIDANAVLAAGGSVIRFKFRGSAWVEIKDGRGKVLLSRNHPSGSEAEVMGKGPFSVVVGNAPEVSMFLNDRPFDLEPHTRVAVARFTIN